MTVSKQVSPRELFITFSKIGVIGFGGVAPFVYRSVVEEKQWLSPEEYGELLGIGQLLPGPNVTNFSAMLGLRFAGVRGAAAATSGLLLFPFFIVLGLGYLFEVYGHHAWIEGALHGIVSVSAGLVLVTGIKLARGQPKHMRSLVFGMLALIAVGVLRLPLLWVVLGLGAVSLLAEWWLFE